MIGQDRTRTEFPMSIRGIHLNKISQGNNPEINHEVNLVTLHTVPPDILLMFLSKLIDESLLCVVPSLRRMPDLELEVYAGLLKAVPNCIAKILRENGVEFSPVNLESSQSHQLIAKLIVGVRDHDLGVVPLRI